MGAPGMIQDEGKQQLPVHTPAATVPHFGMVQLFLLIQHQTVLWFPSTLRAN